MLLVALMTNISNILQYCSADSGAVHTLWSHFQLVLAGIEKLLGKSLVSCIYVIFLSFSSEPMLFHV